MRRPRRHPNERTPQAGFHPTDVNGREPGRLGCRRRAGRLFHRRCGPVGRSGVSCVVFSMPRLSVAESNRESHSAKALFPCRCLSDKRRPEPIPAGRVTPCAPQRAALEFSLSDFHPQPRNRNRNPLEPFAGDYDEDHDEHCELGGRSLKPNAGSPLHAAARSSGRSS